MSFRNSLIFASLIAVSLAAFFFAHKEPVGEQAGATIATTSVAVTLSTIATAEASFPKPVQMMANNQRPPGAVYTFPMTVPDNVTIDTYGTNGYIVTTKFPDHEEVSVYVNGILSRSANNAYITASGT